MRENGSSDPRARNDREPARNEHHLPGGQPPIRIVIHESTETFSAYTRENLTKPELFSLGFHDPLTDLFNRRYFEEEMNRLDTDRQLPLSLIMADVNGLKLINDAFGHRKGDELLIIFSRILKESCRKEDVIARWGGDEFTILLPQTPQMKGSEICQRILEKCHQLQWQPIPISVSLGLATKNQGNQGLFSILEAAEERMFHAKIIASRTTRRTILETLKKELFAIRHETWGNGNGNMLDLHLAMGKQLSLPEPQLQNLLQLAVLHDIGKIALPRDILVKKEILDPNEWDIIKKHPEIGFRIVQNFPDLSPLAEPILSYREHWDGTGYPLGLSGEHINLLSRISSVINAFLAMTRHRPYQPAKTVPQSIREIEHSAGFQFDPHIVSLFLKIVG